MSQPAFVTGTFWRSCPLDVLQAEAETHAMSLELASWHGDSTPALIRALLARVVAAESATNAGGYQPELEATRSVREKRPIDVALVMLQATAGEEYHVDVCVAEARAEYEALLAIEAFARAVVTPDGSAERG
jgi:hypothetical protein